MDHWRVPHVPHHQIFRRRSTRPALTVHEHSPGFNGWLAVTITRGVSTMWCAYLFGALALVSFPDAIRAGLAQTVVWIAQTFLQLVLLSIIMVGQKVEAAASDKQALQTYKDAEALLEISDNVHKLLKTNTALTEEIHKALKP